MLHGQATARGASLRPANALIRAASSRKPVARGSAITTRAGLFDFLTPRAAPAKRNRAEDIVDQLLQLTQGTDGGIKASSAVKEGVEELVSRCMRLPLCTPSSLL